jgi:hypothetical protein
MGLSRCLSSDSRSSVGVKTKLVVMLSMFDALQAVENVPIELPKWIGSNSGPVGHYCLACHLSSLSWLSAIMYKAIA